MSTIERKSRRPIPGRRRPTISQPHHAPEAEQRDGGRFWDRPDAHDAHIIAFAEQDWLVHREHGVEELERAQGGDPIRDCESVSNVSLYKGILKPKDSITNEKDIQAFRAGQIACDSPAVANPTPTYGS